MTKWQADTLRSASTSIQNARMLVKSVYNSMNASADTSVSFDPNSTEDRSPTPLSEKEQKYLKTLEHAIYELLDISSDISAIVAMYEPSKSSHDA